MSHCDSILILGWLELVACRADAGLLDPEVLPQDMVLTLLPVVLELILQSLCSGIVWYMRLAVLNVRPTLLALDRGASVEDWHSISRHIAVFPQMLALVGGGLMVCSALARHDGAGQMFGALQGGCLGML
jgi:hypothetical protein